MYRIVGGALLGIALAAALAVPGILIYLSIQPQVETDFQRQLVLVPSVMVSIVFWMGIRSTNAGFKATEWYLRTTMNLLDYGKIG